ncbi:MAG: hypothetical protein ACKO8Q_00780, partial [Bacteroidota bacterium]
AFMPHLACRTKVYTFPLIKDSEYILLSERESSYPLTAEDYEDFVARIFSDPNWELIVQNDVVVLFKRRNS